MVVDDYPIFQTIIGLGGSLGASEEDGRQSAKSDSLQKPTRKYLPTCTPYSEGTGTRPPILRREAQICEGVEREGRRKITDPPQVSRLANTPPIHVPWVATLSTFGTA